ncbi:MAG: UDP-N-acetylmuramoyl-tripeptide--D-alanyl-D-alanine ligase [Clostridia bacterium]|nr:UDP-N-acetylmuramoyl-tripeptide--D-alanyl-D-alanine ligase [Clostridia bacterium]
MIDINLLSLILLSVCVFGFFSIKIATVFQQCGYRIGEFFSAIFSGKKREIVKLSTYSLLFLIATAVGCVFFNKHNLTFSLYVFTVFTLLDGLYFFKTKIVKKSKLTHRFLRIYFLSAFFSSAFCTAIFLLVKSFLSQNFIYYASLSLAFVPVGVPCFLSLGKIVNFPYDAFRYCLSKAICAKKIAKNKDLIKIGITGSSGKTSVKNYLAKMLQTKYRVLATPSSYNTPLGICKTVRGGLENYDVFIAEMGARRKNDIKELCKMVKPNVGIITSILPQHTKTLGGIKGVKRAKNQLIEGLCGKKSAFFNDNSQESFDLYQKANCEKFLVGERGFVRWQNAVQRLDGIDFDIVVYGKSYKTFTPLLGFHNLENICIAVAVALYLKVDISKILGVIPTLSSPRHRAEIIKTANGVVVVDDGYNANIEGIKSTAIAIGKLSGKKIAVTSGVVELGEEDKTVNYQVGQVLAQNFSLVIAMGVNSTSVKNGALSVGGQVEVLSDMQTVKKYLLNQLKRGDVVAFFSDLPDVYEI